MKYRLMRRNRGSSLVELLVVVCIMSLVAAAISGIMLTQNAVGFRTFSKLNMLMSAGKLQSSIEDIIHTARFIGNRTGPNFNKFTESSTTYQLDPQTLIVQVPVYTTDGFPTTSTANPIKTGAEWNVDTYVYKITADSALSGKGRFRLTLQVFPGDHSNPDYLPAPPQTGSPQVLVSNIVGPINPSDTVDPVANTPAPRVFKYYTRNTPNWLATSNLQVDSPSNAQSTAINGVSMDLELFNNDASERKDMTPENIAFRSEYFLRSNGISQ